MKPKVTVPQHDPRMTPVTQDECDSSDSLTQVDIQTFDFQVRISCLTFKHFQPGTISMNSNATGEGDDEKVPKKHCHFHL